MKKFCIIPAFNEERNIGRVIREIIRYFDEVVVVDDGSSDRTGEEAKAAGAVVLTHILNRGQGAALAAGNAYAVKQGADLLVHFDADGQFSGADLDEAMKPILEDAADIVFGSRFLGKKSDLPWLKEKLIFPIARLINRLMLGIEMTDPQNGFRVFGKKALAAIAIEQDGAAHCSEILYKAARSGLRIREVPITVKYFAFGQSFFSGRGRGQGGFRILKDLLLSKFIE